MMLLMNGGTGLLRRSAECSCFPDYDLGIQTPLFSVSESERRWALVLGIVFIVRDWRIKSRRCAVPKILVSRS